jgi:glycosyltransferase involved in cell wall biosynthesis
MKRPSVAIYVPDLSGGGVERMRIHLSRALLDRGYSVTFVLHQARGELLPLVPPGARVVSLNASRTLAAVPALTRFLRAERPDVLLSSLGHNNVAALWARRLARVDTAVVACQHNALTDESSAIGTWQHRLLPGLYRAFLAQADAIVAVSEGVADDMARAAAIPRERISVIYNPVSSVRLLGDAEHPVRHPWFDDPNANVFVAMGRLVPQKDFATAIRALARVEPALGARLLILGDGPERAELEGLVARLGLGDRVSLLGFVPRPLPYVRRARALVVSSVYEGFGNVLVEALACGTPVISTDCRYGPSEILEGGRFGRLVPVGDPGALANAMRDAIVEDDPASPAELMARASHFDVETVADQYVALFRSVSRPWREREDGAEIALPRGGAVRSVAIYLPDLSGGGAEVSMVRLAQALVERDVDVTFVLHEMTGELSSQVPARARVVTLAAGRTIAALPGLVRFLRAQRPDVLLSGLGHNNVAALWARRVARVDTAVVVCQHNALSRESAAIGTWQHALLPGLYRAFVGDADAIVAVSGGVAADMTAAAGVSPDRITIIPNPVVSPRMHGSSDERPADPWFHDPGRPVFVAMGRLVPQKDFATLIRAFARIDATPLPRLVILGQGPLRADLQALAAELGVGDRVRLLGFVTNPFPYVRHARAFVLSSLYEGFGVVLVEAMACGTPVIATDCPFGPAEILDGGRFGRLVPVSDPRALARAMRDALVGARPSPAVLTERAADFDVERAADRYLEVFEAARLRRGLGASVLEPVPASRVEPLDRPAQDSYIRPKPPIEPPPVRSVAIYVPRLWGGGTEVSMARLARGLSHSGIDVTVLVHNADRPVLEASGVRVVDLRVRRSLAALPGLVRELRNRQPDVLMAALPHNNIVAVVARALSGSRSAVILTEHTPISILLERATGPKYRLLPWLVPLAYGRSDAVVAVSNGVRDDLARILRTKAPRLEVISNPVVPSNWSELASERPPHPWLADDAPPFILSVARFSVEKNIPSLVSAFARVRRDHPQLRLLLIGDGPTRAAILSAIDSLDLRDHVQLAGWIDNPFPYMRRARALVLTSSFEGFGNVLVEAMVCGTPVVSTDCPVGPAEILEQGALGELVPPGDEGLLAEAIGRALRRDGPPPRAVDRALAFTVARSTERYLALFRDLRGLRDLRELRDRRDRSPDDRSGREPVREALG